MASGLVIERDERGGIPMAEWEGNLAASSVVVATPPRIGINPFTKVEHVFRAPAGSAGFSTAGGDCSVKYREGKLIVTGATKSALAVVTDIARGLNAAVIVEGDESELLDAWEGE